MSKKVLTADKYPTLRFVKDVWFILSDQRHRFFFWYIVRLLSSASALIPAYAVGKIIDLLTRYDGGSLHTLYLWLGVIFISLSVAVFARLGSKYQLGNVGRETQRSVRLRALSALLRHNLSWHEEEASGNKVQRINTGTQGLQTFMRFLSQDSTDILVGIVGVAIFFLTLDWQYAAILIVYILAYLSYEYRMNVKQAKLVKEKNAYFEKVSGNMHEVTANIATVKSLGIGDVLHTKAQRFEEQYNELSRKAQFTGTKKWWGIQFISAFFFTTMIYVSAMDIVRGTITLGLMAIIATYIGSTQKALNNLSQQADNVIDAKYAIYRVVPLLKEEKTKDGTAGIPKRWNHLHFRNVSFKYKDKHVLKNISLRIQRGEKIGIVGASGEGKSTILKLLLRLYAPTEGDILFDDVSLQKISQQNISKKISVVPQDVELFNASIKDNIAILNDGTPFAIQRALQVALCEPIIEKLPKGIDSIVGEKGVRLSGGEKQRLAIARAVYADPELLLLDESTSNLDSKTEFQIQNNIENELKEKTVILVAHRLSTLRNVDRIIVLDKGKIIEEGSYDDLLKKKGAFYKLYKLQKR